MQSVEQLLTQLRDADESQAYKLLFEQVQAAMKATRPGAEDERAALAAAVCAELSRTVEVPPSKPNRPPTQRPLYPANVQRTVITRVLQYVAGDAEVPFLVQAMKNLEVREPARCALAYNCSPASTKALIDALGEVGPEFLIGVVGSLGKRRCPDAMTALRKLAGDESYDPEIRLAAVEMLANDPEPANDAIIVAMAQCPCPMTRARTAKARVRLAETLAKAGKKADAKKIYQAIKACKCDHPAQKKAAELALQSL